MVMNKLFLKNRLKSFRFAIHGLVFLLKQEPNAWIHLLITLTAIGLAILLNINKTEWILIVITIGLVFSAEVFNSAVERLVDMISPEQNPQAGVIKDLSAGAVLITAIAAFVVGLIVFIPKLLAFIL